MTHTNLLLSILTLMALSPLAAEAQKIPTLETGPNMPNEWIDSETGHKVIKLTRREGDNSSFYFHNYPFVGNEMLFNGTTTRGGHDSQVYAVDLTSLAIRQVTHESRPVHTEIVSPTTHELFFQWGDSVFAASTDTGQRRLVGVLSTAGKHGSIACVNCDGTLLCGTYSTDEEAEVFRLHPARHDWFNMLTEHPYERSLFTLDTRTGKIDRFYTEVAWLNHMQFSPTDPKLLMFCHEGQWHEVDRIWTIRIGENKARLMHPRTMYREIAGHEWWGADGKHIYFDLQKPRGVYFFIGKVDVNTGKEQDFWLSRHAWSVHFTTSPDETFLCGDGGSPGGVAKSNQNQWIFRYDFDGDSLRTTKLVCMKNHNYQLEPNVHFSPDAKWIIFRANFEGHTDVYAVKL